MVTLLTAILVGMSLFAWFCLVKIVPDCNVSMYRYRLWRVRDRLADQIRWGQFDCDAPARALLWDVEQYIAQAPEVGFVKLLFSRWAKRGCQPEPDVLQRNDLTADDRRRLETYVHELDHIHVRHIAFGSPSGWVITLLLVPAAIVASAIHRLGRSGIRDGSVISEARERVRNETSPAWALSDTDTGTHSLTRAV
jgi:hypothetical protein